MSMNILQKSLLVWCIGLQDNSYTGIQGTLLLGNESNKFEQGEGLFPLLFSQ